MTDKSDKTLKNTVIVLQNITLKKNPVSCISNENDSNINNITKRRYTSSSYIFDEEPLFSDSEEETEYFNNILAVQNLTCIDEMPKRLDVEVQCDITSDNLKIVDVIEKCASFDVGDVNEDFKPLVDLCKQLNFKYRYSEPTSAKKTSKNSVTSNIMTSTSNDGFHQKNFTPSRNGNVGGGSSAFFSQMFCSVSGISNMNSVTKPVDKYEEKENIRRSNRIRKTTTLNNSGIFVIGKDKKKLLKKRHDRVKTRNIKKGKRKNLSEALFSEKIRNGTNTAKRKKLTTGSSNIQAFKVNSKDPFEFTFYQKTQLLPAKQTRSLARNWMKPNKSMESNVVDGSELVSLRQKRKTRRLYSPKEWLQLQELELYPDR